VRVQGMRRFYALLLCSGGKVRLVKALDGDTVLAEAPFDWETWNSYELRLQVVGDRLTAWVDRRLVFDVRDKGSVLDGGAVALICEEGHLIADEVTVKPAA